MPSVRHIRQQLLTFAAPIAAGLAVAMLPRVVLCEPYTIPSASMEPTLQVGDYVLVNKAAYGWSRQSLPFNPPLPHGRIFGHQPQRGDVVVFRRPSDGSKTLIKRLVGLPGDRIQMQAGVLTINGMAIPRTPAGQGIEATPFGLVPVAHYRESIPGGPSYTVNSYGRDTGAGNTGVYVVPAGCYFVMGDNRDNSLDSRFDPGRIKPGQASCGWDASLDRNLPPEQGVGFLPAEDLVGRADRILFSWRHDAAPWNAVRWERTFRKIES
jgi:signal peptidase I